MACIIHNHILLGGLCLTMQNAAVHKLSTEALFGESHGEAIESLKSTNKWFKLSVIIFQRAFYKVP